MTQQNLTYLGIWSKEPLAVGYLQLFEKEIIRDTRAYMSKRIFNKHDAADIAQEAYLRQLTRCYENNRITPRAYRKTMKFPQICGLGYAAQDALKRCYKNKKNETSIEEMTDHNPSLEDMRIDTSLLSEDFLVCLEELYNSLTQASTFKTLIRRIIDRCRAVDNHLDVNTESNRVLRKSCDLGGEEIKVKTRDGANKKLQQIFGKDTYYANLLKSFL
jgi:hypothetical protein